MAIVIKPKKSETASSIPTTNDLAVGEICINVVDQKIYTRKSDDSIVIVGSVTAAGVDEATATSKAVTMAIALG
jgi:hypothetical protein|tara:strand:+ start:292 stop:513 length:222 start_codon:yes stop_codon:yes gene_type:complete